jgi:hypothetical protein
MKFSQFIIPTKLFVALLFACVTLTSCYKEPFYKCKIIVVDAINTPIPGAKVLLKTDVTGATVRDSAETDGQGQVSFEFPNEAVFDVYATKNAQSGKGFIKLENRETVIETVVIQ